MKEFRKSKGVTEHYTSLEELGKAYNCKPNIKRTKDDEKLKKQQENFCKHYRCKACGEPMYYVGGSIMTCCNEKCKGIKVERKDADGNTIVNYMVSYELLDDHFSEVASNIF